MSGCDCDTGALREMMARQIDLTRDMTGVLGDLAGKLMAGFSGAKIDLLPKSGCEIPEPCWMPRDLGEYDCRVRAGATARLEIRITNTDFRPRSFTLAASGPDAARVSFAPASLTLGPKERQVVTVSFDTGKDGGKDESKDDCAVTEHEALVWILGCNRHYLRWTLTIGKGGCDCNHRIEVADQPDYIHHWYDHFYCPRPCLGARVQPNQPKPTG